MSLVECRHVVQLNAIVSAARPRAAPFISLAVEVEAAAFYDERFTVGLYMGDVVDFFEKCLEVRDGRDSRLHEAIVFREQMNLW